MEQTAPVKIRLLYAAWENRPTIPGSPVRDRGAATSLSWLQRYWRRADHPGKVGVPERQGPIYQINSGLIDKNTPQ